MRLRLILLSLLFLSPSYHLFSQHFPINGSSGWGIVDTNGQMIVPRHDQAFVYDPQLQFHNNLSIFQTEDHFSLYRSRLAQLEEIDFDSLYFAVSKMASPQFRQGKAGFMWNGPILSASENYQGLEFNASKQSLLAIMLVKDGQYTLLDPKADTLYHGSVRPRLIANDNQGFIVIAGNKSGYWQFEPKVVIPVKYDKVTIYKAKAHGPACINLLEGDTYHLLVGQNLKDSLQAKGNMRLLNDNRLAVQDPFTSHWGVVNHLNDTIVPLQYDPDFSFLPNFTIARSGNFEAVIDLDGKEIFPLKYESVIPEPNGIFWVKVKKGWALADNEGELLNSYTFSKPGEFEGPVAVVNTATKWGLINQYGEVLAEPKYDAIQVLDNVARLRIRDDISQISFHDDGRHNPVKKLIIKGAPDTSQSARKSAPDSTAKVASPIVWFNAKGKWGLRNDAGVVLPPRFDRIQKLPELPFDLVVSRASTAGELYGFVDPQNVRLVLKPSLSYIFIEDFEESQIARAILPNGYFVLVNSKGAVRRLDQVNYVGPIENGQAIACKGPAPGKTRSPQNSLSDMRSVVKGQWGIMGANGSWIVPPSFQQFDEYQNDVAIVKTNGKWGAIDKSTEFIIAPQFDSLYRPINTQSQEAANWYCSVKNQGRQFFFDASGELLHVQQLQDYRVQSNHYIIAQQDNLWGLIDPQGNWQIKPKYTALGDLSEDMLAYKGNGGWGYLNINGDIVIPPTYGSAMPFYEGKAAIRIGKRWGYIDPSGNEFSKVAYLKAANFEDGVAIVKQDKYFGLLGHNNKWVLSPKYSRLQRNEHGFKGVKEGDTYYFVLDKARLKLNPVNILPESSNEDQSQTSESLNRQQAYHHFVLDSFDQMKDSTQCGERSQLLGLIDSNGQEILPMEFEEIECLGKVFRVVWHGRLGYYSANGRWIVRPEGYR